MKLELRPSEVKRYRKKHKLLSSPVWKNPVRTLGLDLPFLVVTSISLQAAAMMSIQMALIHVGTVISAIVLCRVLPKGSRPFVYPAIATLIMLGASTMLSGVFPMVAEMMGMYIYLMAVNSMTFACAVSVRRTDKLYPVMARALKGLAGFVVVMFVASLLREYLGQGAVWGVSVPHILSADGLQVPFFGFILLGFLLAGARLASKVLQAMALNEKARRDAIYSENWL